MNLHTDYAPMPEPILGAACEVGALSRFFQPTLSEECAEVVGGEHGLSS